MWIDKLSSVPKPRLLELHPFNMETHPFKIVGQKIALNNLFAAPPEKVTADKFIFEI